MTNLIDFCSYNFFEVLMQLIYVGLGGAVGAILRYLFSLVFSASNSLFRSSRC